MISRIEKGETIPTAPLLYLIAKRLGVDTNYFFSNNNSSSPKIDYLSETIQQIRNLISQKKFKEALVSIKLEQKNPLFRKRELQQFLLWG
ncbi:helix-turn-helix domain-containing protein [Evansella sp. AB-rgal1]|uniref:helix-turn-helix domain-containing protein n=1 Tax=Evansella sp. AB-rgal1 TaxID=3242696 RepID=UPI00359EB1DA